MSAVSVPDTVRNSSDEMLELLGSGLAALVVKPSVIGSWESVARLVEWARKRNKPTHVILDDNKLAIKLSATYCIASHGVVSNTRNLWGDNYGP
jgi:O-succinylbenzoate synthase